MEELIFAAAARQGQRALFGDEAVEFELSDFHVQPGTVEQVVEADVRRFEVERTRLVGGRNQQEGNILFQGAAGQNIQSAKIETGGGELLLAR